MVFLICVLMMRLPVHWTFADLNTLLDCLWVVFLICFPMILFADLCTFADLNTLLACLWVVFLMCFPMIVLADPETSTGLNMLLDCRVGRRSHLFPRMALFSRMGRIFSQTIGFYPGPASA